MISYTSYFFSPEPRGRASAADADQPGRQRSEPGGGEPRHPDRAPPQPRPGAPGHRQGPQDRPEEADIRTQVTKVETLVVLLNITNTFCPDSL